MIRPTARAFALLALLALAATAPALADGTAPAKAPWSQSAEEFAADLLVRHDSATHETNASIGFSYWHYATPNIGIGGTVAGLWTTQADGVLAGPSMLANAFYFGCDATGANCRGNVEFGGDFSTATGDLSNEAAFQMSTWGGIRVFTGQSSAAHLLLRYARAVNAGEAGSNGENALDSTSALFRLSWGQKQPQPPPSLR